VRVGLSARALEKTPTAGDLHRQPLPGVPLLHAGVPVRRPQVRVRQGVPYVKKCEFCPSARPRACAGVREVCPSGALQFGKRSELIEEAKTRIYQNPDKYVHHVYGEQEAGGTSFLYVSDVPLEQLGLKAGLRTTPYPDLTKTALSAVRSS